MNRAAASQTTGTWSASDLSRQRLRHWQSQIAQFLLNIGPPRVPRPISKRLRCAGRRQRLLGTPYTRRSAGSRHVRRSVLSGATTPESERLAPPIASFSVIVAVLSVHFESRRVEPSPY